MEIRKAAQKMSTITFALIFIFAGAAPARTACMGVCDCHTGQMAEHPVHKTHPVLSQGVNVRLLKVQQPIAGHPFDLNHHDPTCHEASDETCHLAVAQPLIVFHKELIAILESDHLFTDWVAVVDDAFLAKDTLSVNHVFRMGFSAPEISIPLYLQYLSFIC